MNQLIKWALCWAIIFSSLTGFSNILILNGLTHEHAILGESAQVKGVIKLKNDAETAVKVLFYKQEYLLACGQESNFASTPTHSYSLGRYLTTPLSEKILAPKEEFDLPYSIALPQSSANGSYWSVIMVEAADPITSSDPSGVSINSKVRYAIQVIANKGAFESPKLSFLDVRYNTKNQQVSNSQVIVSLKNEGRFSAKTKVSLEIYNDKGEKIKVFESLSRRIYQDKCNTFEVDIVGLPKGKYEGILIADNGTDLFASNLELSIE